MNEEFKKKYLKYKIKYLELIGGSTNIQGGAEETTEKTKIYSIFNILRDEKDLETIKKALKDDKYKEIYTTDLVEEIAAAIGSDFTESYGENNDKNNGNEIGHIKKYIGDKHIDGLFRNEPYKLFIFIVVEFGKLLNCENTIQVQNMIEILNPHFD